MNKPLAKPPGTRVQAYKLRLYPSQVQERAMVQARGASITVYNWALERYEAGWNAYCAAKKALVAQDLPPDELKAASKVAFDAHMPNRFALSRELTRLKKTEERGWWADVQAQTLTQALIDCERAIQRFLKSVRNKDGERFPGFRGKVRNESFRYQQGVRVTDRHVYLPKIGLVRYRAGRMPEGAIAQATVKREHGGNWYVSVFTERIVMVESVPIDAVTTEGVLLGVDAIVTTSGGAQTLNPQYLERDLDRLARAQRDFARKQGGRKTGKPSSKNRVKALRRVQRIHARIANCRADLAHKLSHDIVKNASAVVTQDADFSADVAAPAPKTRHRKMADAGRGMIRSQIAYKAGWAGKGFVVVESREDSGDNQTSLRSRAEAVRAAGLAVLGSGACPESSMPVEGGE